MAQSDHLQARLVLGKGHDPWYNLAVEEYLLENLNSSEIIIYLWQNEKTVVIGRNQNAWQECLVGKLEADGGKLARRLSGGGAVFHDLGNLNYTILMPRRFYQLQEQLTPILTALQDLGIAAKFSGRNDLLYQDKKISGNAFYYGKKSAYIHGTVLVNSDLFKLAAYLKVAEAKIKAKGIDSVISRVINLTDIEQNITVADVIAAIKNSFSKKYNGGQTLPQIMIEKNDRLTELYTKYADWNWRFGKTPDFDLSLAHRFSWGGIELNLKLSDARIKEAVIYSDLMYSDLVQQLTNNLKDQPFKLAQLLQIVKKTLADYSYSDQVVKQQIKTELSSWLAAELAEIIY